MLSPRFSLAVLLVAFTAVVVAGCTEEPTSPELAPTLQQSPDTADGLDTRFGTLRDVPSVVMDLPPTPRARESDDAALISLLEEEDGHASIGIKAPGAPRAREADGRRAALTASDFLAGLEALEGEGVEIRQVYRSFGGVSVRLDPALGPALREHPRVDYLQPRVWYELDGVVSTAVPTMPSGMSQIIPWGIEMVRAPEAWSVSKGAGVRVQIIDTGVWGHSNLPPRICGGPGGDYWGCTDNHNHGTHVAGVMAAVDTTFGVVGAAPAMDTLHVWGACSDVIRFCSDDQVQMGIDLASLAVGMGLVDRMVVNMSFGKQVSQEEYHDGIANAAAHAYDVAGVLLVAAAGNRGVDMPPWDDHYPAALSHVIAVSGVREDGSFAWDSPCEYSVGVDMASNYGQHVELAAPFWAKSTIWGGAFGDDCGSSVATPHVTGAAALVWAANPSWTNAQVRSQLQATASNSSWNQHTGYGIVDAAMALGIPPALSVSIDGPSVIPGGNIWPCTWTADVDGGGGTIGYEWFTDASWPNPISTHSSVNGAHPDIPPSGQSSFELVVSVTDAYSQSAQDDIFVVTGDPHECQF